MTLLSSFLDFSYRTLIPVSMVQVQLSKVQIRLYSTDSPFSMLKSEMYGGNKEEEEED